MSDDPLWQLLARLTPARIGLGRAGAGLPTREVLKFGLAHAQARDAVHVPMDADAVSAAIEALGFSTLRVASRAGDRATYLQRPDYGRALNEESARRLAEAAQTGQQSSRHSSSNPHTHPEVPQRSVGLERALQRTAQSLEPSFEAADAAPQDEGAGGRTIRKSASEPIDLALVVADGLSARAVHEGAESLLAALKPHIDRNGWNLAPVVVATQARVALGDAIGAALNARMVAVLIGERPGLSSPDSLGIYLTYDPRPGRSDAERNCISNVRPTGLSHEAAAGRLAWLIDQALVRRLSGVALKDESDVAAIGTASDVKAVPPRNEA